LCRYKVAKGQNEKKETTEMDIGTIAPERIAEVSAVGTILIVFLVAVWKGIPALIGYAERKDTAHREMTMSLITRHQEDMKALIASNREERDTFYKNLGIKLDRVHDRLDKIETAVTTSKQSP